MTEQYSCKLCASTVGNILLSNIKDWEYGTSGEYAYYQCVSCEQIQLHPFPDLHQLKEAYPETYPAYISDIKHNRGKFYDLLLRIHTRLRLHTVLRYLKPEMKILDVGSGNGDFLCCFKRYGITELYGIDFNQQAIRIMQEKGIHSFHGLYMDYSAPYESFDVISMNHYIEHVLSPMAELKKSYDLLKPGGILFGILPNFNGLDRMLFKTFWGGNHVPRHTFQYTDKQFEKLLKNAGFNKIRVTHDMNPSHIAISIQNWLQRNVKDLKNNPNIIHGRMKYFNFLLMLCLPLNIIFSLLKRSGTMAFYAVKCR